MGTAKAGAPRLPEVRGKSCVTTFLASSGGNCSFWKQIITRAENPDFLEPPPTLR